MIFSSEKVFRFYSARLQSADFRPKRRYLWKHTRLRDRQTPWPFAVGRFDFPSLFSRGEKVVGPKRAILNGGDNVGAMEMGVRGGEQVRQAMNKFWPMG